MTPVTWLNTPSGSVKERAAAYVRVVCRVMTHPLFLMPADLLLMLWSPSRVTRASIVSKRPLNQADVHRKRGWSVVSLRSEGGQRVSL